MNWRQKSVARLAAQPEQWVRLGELFADIEESIPVHKAMRLQTSKHQIESGLNSARWSLFLTHITKLVERKAGGQEELSRKSKRSDFVRLRVDDIPCDTCGGPRYLSSWPGIGQKFRQYACPRCKPVELPGEPVLELPVEVPVEEVLEEAPIAAIEPVITEPPQEAKPRLNAHQRRGIKPSMSRQSQRFAVRKRIKQYKATLPKKQKPPTLPQHNPVMVPSPNALPERRSPIQVSTSEHRVTFRNRRTLAQSVKNILGLQKSTNKIDAELERSGLAAVLAKHGKTLVGFASSVFYQVSFKRSSSQ